MWSAYLVNKMPLKAIAFKGPLEVPQERIAYNAPLKMFGCTCFVHAKIIGKVDPMAFKCVFVGYSPTQKDYKCYPPPSRKHFISMDITFRD